ncbi:hypothetical protein [Hyphomicrobium sp. CS1GBMeth3]|uniref:hypothetical protein n=1 Tax=Hyphomicrobium sp. CS1GBMeth3 TaxID=1892845 RepID=UPI000930D475|nr:hypothetical protein [Hyphomicrobium sp. CS1GBMeth3]
MQKFKSWAVVALIMTVSPFLAACETLGIATAEKKASVSAASVLRNVPEVENSPDAPCWQQRQIAKQRAYIHSVTKGKPKRYHADCTDEPPTKPTPKTS